MLLLIQLIFIYLFMKQFARKIQKNIAQKLQNPHTQFNQTLQSTFFSQVLNPYFYDFLNTLLHQKQIIFLRHAQSQINLWATKPRNFFGKYPKNRALYDPSITITGFQQCQNFKDDSTYYITYISPSLRTLQTYQNINLNTKKYIITHLIRQRSKHIAAVIGKSLDQLKISFPLLDFSYIKQNYWWRYDYKNLYDQELDRQSNQNVQCRLAFFFLWILIEGSKRIMIISHSVVYQHLHELKYFQLPNNVELLQIKHEAIIKLFKKIEQRISSKL